MTDYIQEANENINKIDQLFEEIKEMQQNRSNFALEKFVVGSHDLPGRQRKQVLDELLSVMQGLQQVVTEYELTTIDIQELNEATDNHYQNERNIINLRSKERDQKFQELRIIGLIRECNALYQILEALPKYTREKFEAEEAQYWTKRLSKQFFLAQHQGNQGNLDAIHQLVTGLGVKPDMPITLPDIANILGYELVPIERIGDGKSSNHKLAGINKSRN